MPPRGGVSVAAFAREPLKALFGPHRQVEYLYSYLRDQNASSLVYEQHYVDRHYLDDFAHYYARSFDAPLAGAGRLHAFTLSAEDLEQALSSAYSGTDAREAAQVMLEPSYLGAPRRRPGALPSLQKAA